MHYYITRDVAQIMMRWCDERGYRRPDSELIENCFKDLRTSLEYNFKRKFDIEKAKFDNAQKRKTKKSGPAPSLTILDTKRFDWMRDRLSKKHYLKDRDEQKSAFWISLDCVYTPELGWNKDADFLIQVTRIYDPDGYERLGTGTRPHFPTANTNTPYEPLEQQIDFCAAAFNKVKRDIRNIYVVDDGVFTGGTFEKVLRLLLDRGVFPTHVVSALSTSRGKELLHDAIDPLVQAHRNQRGSEGYDIGYSLGEERDTKQLLDWVCERDFYFGVPFGGRTVGAFHNNALVPVAAVNREHRQSGGIVYALGSARDLHECATIDLGAFATTRVVFRNSLALWRHVEEKNKDRIKFKGKKLPLRAIPRLPYPLTVDGYDPDASFTDWLARGLEWFGDYDAPGA